jgi:hypothetical protein
MMSAVRSVDPVFNCIVPPGRADGVLIQQDTADSLEKCSDVSFYRFLVLMAGSGWFGMYFVCVE